MKMHKNIFVGFMALCVASPAFAAEVNSDIATSWVEDVAIQYCHTEFAGDFCIQDVCKNENNINVYLAKTISENGVEFCPGMLDYDRPSNSNRPALKSWYSEGKGQDDCFWLCKGGYGGKNCSVNYSTGAQTCDAVEIEKFITNSDKAGSALAWAYFKADTHDCSKNKITTWNGDSWKETNGKDPWHYLTLGIKKLLPHGAIVQPITARAAGRRNYKGTGVVIVTPIDTASWVLCKDGYKPNLAQTDCEPISPAVCGVEVICDGWDKELFKNTETYKKKQVYKDGSTKDTCVQYRCKQNGYGFAGDPTHLDDSERECIKCSADGYYATIMDNGQCILTPLEDGKGVEYDENGNVVQFELEKTRKRDMINKKDASGKPCWQYLVDDEEEFRNCLSSGTSSSSSSDSAT